MSSASTTNPSHGWGHEFRAMFFLAWPLIVAQLAQSALYTTDVILLSWLGPEQLAASTLANAFYNPFLLLGAGIVNAVAPLVAQAIGSRQIKAVRRTVRQGLWAAIALSLVLIPIILQIEPALLWAGQDPVTAHLAAEYMSVAAFIIPPALGIFTMRAFLSALGSTKVILYVTLAGVIINAFLAYGLIFGHYGLPRLEMRGAAVATLIVNIFMFAALLTYALTHKKYRRYNILVRFWKPDWQRFFKIFRIGFPIGLATMAEISMFAIAAIFIGWLGTAQLAAHAVTLQLASLSFMVPMGLSMAATVRVGHAFGAGFDHGVGRAGWMALILSTGFMSIACFIFITFPAPLISLFLNPSDAKNLEAFGFATSFLMVAGLFQIADGVQVVGQHILRGLNDTKIPMFIALVGYWIIGIPTAYYLGDASRMGGVGVWLGLATGLAFVSICLTYRFANRKKFGLMDRRF